MGGAFELDGDLGRVEIPDHPSLRLHRFTLEAWVYLTSASWEAVVSKPVGGTIFNSYTIWVEDGSINAAISDGVTSPVHMLSGVQAPLEEFFHVALTWDGDRARLYLNGGLIAVADPESFEVGYTATPLYLGVDDNGPGYGMGVELDGRIDELAIFDRALSDYEIAEIHGAGGEGKWRDADGDGVADRVDRCPGLASGAGVDDVGCPESAIDSDG